MLAMRRNCPNCGERYEGSVCPKCGAPAAAKKAKSDASDKFLTDEQRAKSAQRAKELQKDRNALLVILVIAAAIAVFIFYKNGLFGGGSYKTPIVKYFDAICQRDFNGYIEVMTYNMGQDYVSEREELGYSEYEYLDKLYADLFEQFGADMTASVEFLGRKRPDEELLRSFKTAYLSDYGVNISTDAVYNVSVNVTFSGSTAEAVVPLDCFVMRLEGKWYIVGCDFPVVEEADK